MELEASGLQIGYGDHVIVNHGCVNIVRNKNHDDHWTKWLKVDIVKRRH